MTTTNVLIKSSLDYVALNSPQFFNYVSRDELEQVMQEAFESSLPSEFTLSSENIDYEGILLKFTQELQTKQAWSDVAQTAVGQTLLRNISAGLKYLDFAITRATQTTYLTPGSPKSAIYNAMNFLGVEPRRKIPAKIKARLSIPDHDEVFTVPALTQFEINDVYYFNRDDIVYSEYDMYLDVELVQGQLYEMEGEAVGTEYEFLEIGYENFNISNEDVYVFVNGEKWTKAKTLRPWMLKSTEKIFLTKTLDTGNVLVQFGNDIYGKKLENSDTVKFIWSECLGAQTPAVVVENEFINTSLDLTVEGTILTGIYNNDDELPLELYQKLGPNIRSSNERSVTRSDYVTNSLEFPKIRDAIIQGQAEIAPGKRNWMNIIRATLLTSEGGIISNENWDKYIEFMNSNSIYQLTILRKDPVIIGIDLSAEIFCAQKSQLDYVKSKLIESIRVFNEPKIGSLGYYIEFSDLASLLEGEALTDELQTQIAYAKNITVTYTSGFDTSLLSENEGIQSDNSIYVDNFNFIKINNINLSFNYTNRSILNRRDITSRLVP